jgi:hypothetical protein
MYYRNSNGLGQAFSCNTAGGYSLQQPTCYAEPACMTAAQLSAFNAQCAASTVTAPTLITSSGNVTSSPSQAATIAPPVVPAATPSSVPPAIPLAASSANAAVPTSDFWDSIVSWAEANPVLAGAIGIGAVLLLARGL